MENFDPNSPVTWLVMIMIFPVLVSLLQRVLSALLHKTEESEDESKSDFNVHP